MAAKKLWATSYPRIVSDKCKHGSKAAVYRWVKDQAGLVDRLRSPHVSVWVDERDGQGWQLYESLDLREVRPVV
jgi:hypothetical protein